MVKKEQTIAEKLKDLHDLQVIDSQLDEIQILKGELPVEVSDLEDEIAGFDTRIERLQNAIRDLDADISRYHGNIKDSESLILKYNKQLDSVKNNREYEALTKEIELQELDIKLSEKKIREAKANIELKKETLAGAEERKNTKLKDLEAKKVELEKIIEKTEKDEEKLNKQIDKARKKIEERLLNAYDKIRKNYRNGLAVAAVERDACGGCFNQIPPQLQLEISLCKKIIACEHCGRVLMDQSVIHADSSANA
jgi:predicted  nucleic acid-binding Zn-ribbon protein